MLRTVLSKGERGLGREKVLSTCSGGWSANERRPLFLHVFTWPYPSCSLSNISIILGYNIIIYIVSDERLGLT